MESPLSSVYNLANGVTRLDGYFMPSGDCVERPTDNLDDTTEYQSDSDADADADEMWGMDITNEDVFLASAATITPMSLKNKCGNCHSLSLRMGNYW